MRPNINFMQESFRRFNKDIFGGKLICPAFRLTRARTFQGKCVYRRESGMTLGTEIRLSVEFDMSREEWEDVMIHEMIHLCIAYIPGCREKSHGPTFRSMMNTINQKHSRHITISARRGTSKVAEHLEAISRNSDKIRRYYVCLGITRDGRPVGFRAAGTRLFKVWDAPSRIPGIRSWIWVGGLDSRLERIPKALEPRFYYLQNLAEWRLILAEVFALEKRGSTIYSGIRLTVKNWLNTWCPQLLISG